MKHWGVWAAAVLLAVSVSGCGEKNEAAPANVAVDPAFEAEQQQWRQQRYEALHAADGWTSLVGLHWLEYKGQHRLVHAGAWRADARGGQAGHRPHPLLQ